MRRLLSAATVLMGLPFLAVAAPAHAAGPRPLFQLPFPCGDSWHLQTYRGHDDYDIDMFANSGTTNGRPILAAHGGTVAAAGFDSGGGNFVRLNHGGGWESLYLHMISPPVVSVGQSVVTGQRLGNVGSTGASSAPHLHHEQRRDGVKVEAWFNGVPSGITSDGDPSTGPLFISGPVSAPVDVVSNNSCPVPTPNGRLGDFDGNGKPDIAAYNSDRSTVFFSRNTSSPGAPSKAAGQLYSSGWGTVEHKFTVDWDGDGKDDILGRSGDDLLVWRSTSTSSAWGLAPFVNLGAGNSTVSQFLLGDFDGDGKPDLAAFTGDNSSVFFSRNTSTPGAPSKAGGQFYSSGWSTVNHKMIGDWDGDGKDDILGRSGDDLLVWRSTGSGLAPFVNLGTGNSTVSQFLTSAPVR